MPRAKGTKAAPANPEPETTTEQVRQIAQDLTGNLNFGFDESNKSIVPPKKVTAPAPAPLDFGFQAPAASAATPTNGASVNFSEVTGRLDKLAERMDQARAQDDKFQATVAGAFNQLYQGIEKISAAVAQVMTVLEEVLNEPEKGSDEPAPAPAPVAAPTPKASASKPAFTPSPDPENWQNKFKDMILNARTPGMAAQTFAEHLSNQLSAQGHVADVQTCISWLVHHGVVDGEGKLTAP